MLDFSKKESSLQFFKENGKTLVKRYLFTCLVPYHNDLVVPPFHPNSHIQASPLGNLHPQANAVPLSSPSFHHS
jgi:hypothetical protein